MRGLETKRRVVIPAAVEALEAQSGTQDFQTSPVSRHITDLIEVELLGIDKEGKGNLSQTDPLSEAMLATPAIQTLLAHAEIQGNDRGAREFKARL
jgi:hypothetical protein